MHWQPTFFFCSSSVTRKPTDFLFVLNLFWTDTDTITHFLAISSLHFSFPLTKAWIPLRLGTGYRRPSSWTKISSAQLILLHVVIGKWAYLWQRQGSAHTVPWPGSPWPDQSCSAGSGCASASWSPQLPSVPMSVAADMTRCQLWTQMHNTNYLSHQVKTTTKNFLNKRKHSDVAHVFKMGATLFRPWATVCGWQDVKPQELTFHLRNAPLWSNTKRTNLKISLRYQFSPPPPHLQCTVPTNVYCTDQSATRRRP